MGYHLKERSVRQRGTNLRHAFDANGQPLTESAFGNRYLFQGREYSWAVHAAQGGAGLYNFRARWPCRAEAIGEGGYDPRVGRWLSNDPIGISGGLNQYAAFGNNPVVFVDPWGLEIRGFWRRVGDFFRGLWEGARRQGPDVVPVPSEDSYRAVIGAAARHELLEEISSRTPDLEKIDELQTRMQETQDYFMQKRVTHHCN